MKAYSMDFEHLHHYDAGDEGITLPITLKANQVFVSINTKLDCGSSYCIFQRFHGERLGLDIETGHPMRIGTATGSFLTYGHEVTLSFKDYDFDAMVYFARDEAINRDVLGRHGWLDRVNVGLIDYEGKCFLNRYLTNGGTI